MSCKHERAERVETAAYVDGYCPICLADCLATADLEIERLRAAQANIKAIVDEQANDEGLWFVGETCAEAYVQQALRRLHAAIEGKTPEQCAMDALEHKADTKCGK